MATYKVFKPTSSVKTEPPKDVPTYKETQFIRINNYVNGPLSELIYQVPSGCEFIIYTIDLSGHVIGTGNLVNLSVEINNSVPIAIMGLFALGGSEDFDNKFLTFDKGVVLTQGTNLYHTAGLGVEGNVVITGYLVKV